MTKLFSIRTLSSASIMAMAIAVSACQTSTDHLEVSYEKDIYWNRDDNIVAAPADAAKPTDGTVKTKEK